jgi:hypothetical protein
MSYPIETTFNLNIKAIYRTEQINGGLFII